MIREIGELFQTTIMALAGTGHTLVVQYEIIRRNLRLAQVARHMHSLIQILVNMLYSTQVNNCFIKSVSTLI